MSHRALVVAVLLSVPTLAFGQGRAAAPSVEGVWKIAEVVTTGANAATNGSPQPSLIIFARGHYSYVSVNGATQRPTVAAAKDPNKLTDAEKIARYEQWNPFSANAGTYDVKGTTITRRPLVAKNPAVMTTNPPIAQEFTLDGNTLWLISKSAAGEPASETRTKLVHVR